MTETLDKREIAELRAQIEKCRRLKLNNPEQGDERDVNKEEVLKDKQAKLSATRQARRKLKDERHELDVKLRRIKDELEELEEQREALEEEKDDFRQGPEYEKTKEFKDEILRLRDDKQREEQRYQKALREFNEEQQLVEYVAWASEVRKVRLEEREAEKLQRQKDRQRNDRREGKKEGEKGDKDKNEKGEAAYERPPPPHPYAKEIGFCNFLLQYCQSLKPAEEAKEERKEKSEAPEVNVEEELKKGVWAKEKGVEVIVPRKRLNIDEAPERRQRVRERPKEKEESNEVGHNLEIERLFEQVKLSAPKARDAKALDEAIAKLQEKKDYYQSNFSAPRTDDRNRDRDREREEGRPKPKYERKGDKEKLKLKLELADFPALV